MRSPSAYQLCLLVLLSVSRSASSQNATNMTDANMTEPLLVMTVAPTEGTMPPADGTTDMPPMDMDMDTPATMTFNPTDGDVLTDIPAETASPSIRGSAAATMATTMASSATTDEDIVNVADSTAVPTETTVGGGPVEAEVETPTTEAPLTEAPLTDAPLTEAPLTEAPLTDAPSAAVVMTMAPTPMTTSNTSDIILDELTEDIIGNETDSLQGDIPSLEDDEQITTTDEGVELTPGSSPSFAPVPDGECAVAPIGNTDAACQQLLKFTQATCQCSVFCSGKLIACLPFGERTSFSCSGETVAGCTEAQRALSGAVSFSRLTVTTAVMSMLAAMALV